MFENHLSYKTFEKRLYLRSLFVIHYILHKNCERATREHSFCDVMFETFNLYQNLQFAITKV